MVVASKKKHFTCKGKMNRQISVSWKSEEEQALAHARLKSLVPAGLMLFSLYGGQFFKGL